MTPQTPSIFFDGKSSVPQNIILSLDKAMGVLSFETTAGEHIYWDIKAVSFSKRGTALNIEHGNDPIQNITISDVGFINSLIALKSSANKNWYDILIAQGMKMYLVIAVLILALIGLSYGYFIPWVAEKSVALIPESYDDKLGEIFFSQNVRWSSIDSSKTEALNLFAAELRLNNTKKLKFTVIDSEIVNAYALPDGNIVVYTGILDSMENYDELVGLIGHEASHVNNRHSMKMMCRNLSGYLFISAILGDVNGILATIGDNVNTLQSLSFSREFEHQADSDGYKILLQNRVDPHGMSNLFKRLDDDSSYVPEFLSSHPITKERLQFIDKLIKTESFHTTENPKLKTLFKALKHETLPNRSRKF